ncbi:MAG: EAL domain-containing protein [Ruminiclostridium sp.]|nr:EAL domain-containing protein [Ruminiclostridium sp.]
MIGDTKVIGICLTKCEDDLRTNFLSAFHRRAAENGYKLIVFNSLRDLYYNDEHDKGSASIYNIINYDVLDALVILGETIYDETLKNRIINEAASRGIPTVLIHGEHDRCLCILPDYTEAYSELLKHVIIKHNVKRPVFIAGRRENDPDSLKRLGCLKNVLAQFDIPFSDDRVYYGEYWNVPTIQAMNDHILKLPELPDAIICANDTMAMTVCDELAAAGIKVPEQIIVTGFDGLVSAEYFIPRLTTCCEDIPGLAKIAIELIINAENGGAPRGVFYDTYTPYYGESCGCGDDKNINYRERARYMYRFAHEMQDHEAHIFTWVDSILESENLNALSSALKDYILPNSSVCIFESFLMTALGKSYDKSKPASENDLFVISSMALDYSLGKQSKFSVSEMIPDVDNWLKDSTMCILSPIFVGTDVCGYYAAMTDDIATSSRKIFRVSKTMNIAFGSLLGKLLKRNMQSSMMNAMYMDSLTGLPNLKGLTQWFDEFASVLANHNRTIMVSIYAIPQYKFIYENFGIDDIDEAVRFVADALRLANKSNGYIARTADDEFIIINYVDDESEVSYLIDDAVAVFFGMIEGYNNSSDKEYYLEVNCGCTVANAGWNGTLRSFMKLANAEMYMNRLKAGLSPVMKEDKQLSTEEAQLDRFGEFRMLIENNLLTYCFQPIVDARTGAIYAYEALMRSSGGIKMSPLEILDIAKEYNMLYEVEKATMFNVMSRYESERESFGDAKVFINTIPGNFLKQEDISKLKARFGQYISNFVIEITEQDTVSDEELEAIRHLGIIGNSEEYANVEGGQIAVDDYGTGHSNIVNLLRYAPHIIKIDRFLITNIQNDPNKQMFVKSTIEFAKMNNIKVLAEGVETFEEMRTVIEYGVDLIQGYYTARPSEVVIKEIPEEIRGQIIDENISLARYDSELLTYRAQRDEVIDLYDLTLKKFGKLQIPGGNVTVTGNSDFGIEFTIATNDGSASEITFDNIFITSPETPAIQLGHGSNTVITLKGDNRIHKNAIYVPDDASVRFVGDGNLSVMVKKNGGVGIGASWDEPFGDISFDQTGIVSVEAAIDKCVCIGGGIPGSGAAISISDGVVKVMSKCVDSIGIGSVNGKAKINVYERALITSRCSGRHSISLGSYDGDAQIYSCGDLDLISDGERACSIGTLNKGSADIKLDGGTVSAIVHGDCSSCIGSLYGKVNVECVKGRISAYGEGDSVCGYGSNQGKGVVYIHGGTVSVKILSGNIMQFGSEFCTVVITGGNVVAADDDLIHPVNDAGEPLTMVCPHGSKFSRTVHSASGDYIYEAARQFMSDEFRVYLP